MSDRSPQRVIMSVKKRQVRYYHRSQVFRKSRSERTTRRKKNMRIKVDVSKPSFPYEEPRYCVKLAIHHGVAAFYTDYVLRYDATCYCNELCDFVCGEKPNNVNKNNSTDNKLQIPTRPKSLSTDSGFYESYFTLESPTETVQSNEFVNIDVSHQSVWFCRSTPLESAADYITTSCNVLSESATENECSGPPGSLCFQWHRDLQKSITVVKENHKSWPISESNAFTDIRKSLLEYDRRERANSNSRLHSSNEVFKRLRNLPTQQIIKDKQSSISKSSLQSSYSDSNSIFLKHFNNSQENLLIGVNSNLKKSVSSSLKSLTTNITPVKSRSTSFRIDI